MISARRGPTPASFLRSSRGKLRQLFGNAPDLRDGRQPWRVRLWFCKGREQTAASDSAVPEVAMTTLGLARTMRSAMRLISRVMNPLRRRSSGLRGGSWRRNSLVRRTAPKGRLTVSRMCPLMEMVSSQLPPPRSIIRTGDALTRAIGDQAEVNQAGFFDAGDDVELPSGGGADPFEKSLRVTGIAQCAGGDDADGVGGGFFARRDGSGAALSRYWPWHPGERKPLRKTDSPRRVTSRSS